MAIMHTIHMTDLFGVCRVQHQEIQELGEKGYF